MRYIIHRIEDHLGNEAELYCYLQDNSPELDMERRRPAIVICPGGGYQMTSDREAEPIAIKFLQYGFQTFVLHYSIFPMSYPSALVQLAKSVQLVRLRADEWGINPQKIVVAGFSAGGHLVANLGVAWDGEVLGKILGSNRQNWRPNALLLSYPVISSGDYAHEDSFKNLLGKDFLKKKEELSLEKSVSQYTPPCFIWHTAEDGLVLAENSLLFVQALRNNSIPVEFHLFGFGGHGLSLGTTETALANGYGIEETVSVWVDLFIKWFEKLT